MIFAIDPGTTESAFVAFAHDEIIGKGHMKNADILEGIALYRADTVVCEMIACYGMAVGKETFETCRWIGRFEQAAIHAGKRFETVFRAEVKMHLCKSMKAKDGNIRQALIDRYGAVGTKKKPGKLFGVSSHIWAALAVAVTYSDKTFNIDGKTCWFTKSPCETCFQPLTTNGTQVWCSRGECKNESLQPLRKQQQ